MNTKDLILTTLREEKCYNCASFGKEKGYCMITGDDTQEHDTCTGWDKRTQEDDE